MYLAESSNNTLVPDYESLGAVLKRGRELRSISLEEVAEATCVRMNYLDAIEANQLERLPGLVFLKGYVKAYANYVGLNLEETMVLLEDYTAPRTEQKKSALKKEAVIAISAIVLALLACFAFWFFKSL